MHDTYETPLNSRYASREMQKIFSPDRKFTTWRKLWVALAESEMEMGLPVTQAQVDELKAHVEDIDYEAARRQLTICETGISKLEERCRQLDAEMEQNACDAEKLQELFREKQDLETQLEQEMARWEELSLQLEE